MLLETALVCLSLNVYHEAKNQSLVGQAAVAEVVMNRVADSRYPNTVCEVVKQGPHRPSWKDPNKEHPVRHKCQFSWYCDGKSDNPIDDIHWKRAKEIARLVLHDRIIIDVTEGATHYHATYVSPAWSKHLKKTVHIQDHIFYK